MDADPQVNAQCHGDVLQVVVGGTWNIDTDSTPAMEDALLKLKGGVRELLLEARGLGQWDSSLLVFLVRMMKVARSSDIAVTLHVPDGLSRLVNMAQRPSTCKTPKKPRDPFLFHIGAWFLSLAPDVADFLGFLKSLFQAFHGMLLGRTQMRFQDFFGAMETCGMRSLPIVACTSMLFGLILAFVGAVQLARFGAEIYVAGLVGIAMLRIMGAIMVGVVMAGRVGAAFAAELGTMQVNEEVDALEVNGISPLEFLVLPRVLALTLMIPLLTLYADIMGCLGGYLVGILVLNLNPMEYYSATLNMTPFYHVLIGLVYAVVFGIVIGVVGCYQGLRCGRSAQAVGNATTAAVVHAIVGIIVMTALITIFFNALKL
ncbi:MAG: ABC transporter permease [Desulfovibrio sp.]|jgi:phospholipid/cholesterol/gamma-HCH transport system permease protein|nr:ABC transporter permease [Desulfovibrio sp.]